MTAVDPHLAPPTPRSPNAPKKPGGGWMRSKSARRHACDSASRQKSALGHSSQMKLARLSVSHWETAKPPWPS